MVSSKFVICMRLDPLCLTKNIKLDFCFSNSTDPENYRIRVLVVLTHTAIRLIHSWPAEKHVQFYLMLNFSFLVKLALFNPWECEGLLFPFSQFGIKLRFSQSLQW